MTGSIFFPALEDLQQDLHANDNLVAATVSVFIAGQGVFPSVWASLSEATGRKYCCTSVRGWASRRCTGPDKSRTGGTDIASLTIYIVGTIVCSQAHSMGVFIAMRVLQSLGSSAVLALGAGTLADIYEVRFTQSSLRSPPRPCCGSDTDPFLSPRPTSAARSWGSTTLVLSWARQ